MASSSAAQVWDPSSPGLFRTAAPNAPSEFGWPLAPNADGVWTSAGDGRAFAVSSLFDNGVLIGEANRTHPYAPHPNQPGAFLPP